MTDMTTCLKTPNLSHLSSLDYDEVYEPAEDSFLLLDALEKDLKIINILQPSLCLEVGCGSGIISTCVAQALGHASFVLATDINTKACTVTRKTALHNNTHVETVVSDLIGCLRLDQAVDLLLFNPPYVVTESEEVFQPTASPQTLLHRAWAGGKRGREVIDRFIPRVAQLLAPKSLFYLVVIKENDPEEIMKIMREKGFQSSVVLNRKIRGEHLSVLRFNRGIVI